MRAMAIGVVAAAAFMAAVAAWPWPGPMNHGWDWPWHDWWHSGWTMQHGWFHHDCRTSTQTEKLPNGAVTTRTIESC